MLITACPHPTRKHYAKVNFPTLFNRTCAHPAIESTAATRTHGLVCILIDCFTRKASVRRAICLTIIR